MPPDVPEPSQLAQFIRTLGGTLKRVREANGLTQEQVAFTAGVHETYLRRVETGRTNPSAEVLIRLCNSLNIAPSALLAEVESITDWRLPGKPFITYRE